METLEGMIDKRIDERLEWFFGKKMYKPDKDGNWDKVLSGIASHLSRQWSENAIKKIQRQYDELGYSLNELVERPDFITAVAKAINEIQVGKR